MTINRTERGWPGHYICAEKCLFRRNTLLEYGNKRIVVSTIGAYVRAGQQKEIGLNRYYETKSFEAKQVDDDYWEADTTKQVFFDSPCYINHPNDDHEANNMHETVVKELTNKLTKGD